MKVAFTLAFLALFLSVPAKPDDAVARVGQDADAIGARGLGNWYSLEKEISIGKEYAQMVEQSVKLNQSPLVNEYVNRIGQNLVRNSDAKVPFTFKVIDSDEVNVIALPGGFIYVNTGLIMAADEEAELAGVMSHEIAHVVARHATRQATRGQIANLASGPLVPVNDHLALPLTFVAFPRGFETEADYLGVQYMYKAGYDPQAFVSFFEKVQAKEKRKTGTLAKAFATHPQTPDRIEKTQQEIATILPPRDQYVVSTSEFARIVMHSEDPSEFHNDYTVFRIPKGFRIVGRISQDLDLFHMVELRIDTDGKTETKRINVVGKSSSYLVETFDKPRRITLDPGSHVLIVTQPGGVQVYLEDAFKGITSDPEGKLRIEDLAPGSYQLRLTLPGYKQWKQQVTLTSGQTLPITAKLEVAGPKPLALEEVEEALKNGISKKRVGELVKQFGVDFVLTEEVEKRLRAADADDALLLTITKSKK